MSETEAKVRPFNIIEADAEDGCITICLSKSFAPVVSLALQLWSQHTKQDSKFQAGVFSSQLYKVVQWLAGDRKLEDLVDCNGRELVEMIIQADGVEMEFRKSLDNCPDSG